MLGRLVQWFIIVVSVELMSVSTSRPQISWSKTSGPERAVSVNVFLLKSDSTILAGLQNEGLYRTSTANQTWTTTSLENMSVYTLMAEPMGTLLSGTSRGIHRSSDDGNTWTPLGLTTHHIGAIGRPASSVIVIGTLFSAEGYLYRSPDNGTSWTQVGSAPASFDAIVVTPIGTVLAGTTGRGIYRSPDTGLTWLPSNSGLSTQTITSFAITLMGTVLCGTDRGVFKSTDDGNTWQPTNLSHGRVNSLSRNPATNHMLASTFGGGVYRSTDNGVSWQSLGQNILNVMAALELTIDYVIIGTQDRGVHFTSDAGSTWQTRNEGFRNAASFSIAMTPSGYLLAGRTGGSGGGVYRSTDQGHTWAQTSATPYTSHSIVAKHNGMAFYSAASGIYSSTDEGATWVGAAHVEKSIKSIVLDTDGYLYASAQWSIYPMSFAAIFLSTNDGMDWQDIGTCFGSPGVLGISFESELFGVASMTVYPYTTTVFRKSGGGCTTIQAGLPNAWGIRSFAFSDSGFVFAAHDSGVFRSTNNGASWFPKNSGLTTLTARCFTFDGNGHLFVGTGGGGVFRSTDAGESWSPMNEGLTNLLVHSLARDSSGYLYVGTEEGVFRTISSTTHIVEASSRVGKGVSLLQNYPNPFNTSTQISFTIGSFGEVSLKVYDIVGQEVATVLKEHLQPGNYNVRYNAHHLASGVYYYRLASEGAARTNRFVLIK